MEYLSSQEKPAQSGLCLHWRRQTSSMGARHSSNLPGLINTLLPPELLSQIFGLLPPADLRTVLLVCHLWREVGEAPGLWTWASLRATRENMANMPERLARRKLLRVFGLALGTGVKISEELLGAVDRHPGLSRMVMKKVELALVEPAQLAGLLDTLTGQDHLHRNSTDI